MPTERGGLVRKLDPAKAAGRTIPEADVEGIVGFFKAIVALEKLLDERYRAMAGKAKAGQAAHDFFKAFDLDGDGVITREEWAGSHAVFMALDADGKITPAAGVGGAFVLAK